MSVMSSPRELFLHELGDLLYAEQSLTKVLPELAEQSSDTELREAFQHHLEETRKHIENLEQVFARLGEKPKAERCPGIEGLRKEHDDFVSEESPSPEILDLFNTGAAARTEHYEIAAYTGLITMARSLGQTEAIGLLEQNLRQEEQALQKVNTIAQELGSKQPAA